MVAQRKHPVRVGMHVDEPRRHYASRRIDHRIRRGRLTLRRDDIRDRIVANEDIPVKGFPPCAVDDSARSNQECAHITFPPRSYSSNITETGGYASVCFFPDIDPLSALFHDPANTDSHFPAPAIRIFV